MGAMPSVGDSEVTMPIEERGLLDPDSLSPLALGPLFSGAVVGDEGSNITEEDGESIS